jgi:hypothetical protein
MVTACSDKPLMYDPPLSRGVDCRVTQSLVMSVRGLLRWAMPQCGPCTIPGGPECGYEGKSKWGFI